jgi:hypothetical protein
MPRRVNPGTTLVDGGVMRIVAAPPESAGVPVDKADD